MAMDDIVLAFDRDELPPAWCGERSCVKTDVAEFRLLVNSLKPVLKKRGEIEHDACYKQPIPYVVFCDADKRVACFPRHSSEVRIHGLWSVGVGGHVDAQDQGDDLFSTLINGAYRELAEEMVGFCPKQMPLHFCGVINEELTSVGHTHFGCVFKVKLRSDQSVFAAQELEGLVWMTQQELGGVRLELWSEMALQLIDG